MAWAEELANMRRYGNSQSSASFESKWAVFDAVDYADASTTLAAVLPTTFTFPDGRIVYLNDVPGEEYNNETFWIFSASYVLRTDPVQNQQDLEFEVSASSERYYQAIDTTPYVAAGDTAPDFGGAIGVSTSPPAGMEPLVPESTFSITRYWATSEITPAYRQYLADQAGLVNSAIYQDYAAGALKFMGARGQQQDDKFPITYNFGIRSNQPSKTVGPINVGTKKGWWMEDTLYKPKLDVASGRVVQFPVAVYLHQVDRESTFGGLGLT